MSALGSTSSRRRSHGPHLQAAREPQPDGPWWAKPGRYSLVYTVSLALVGIAVGVALSRWVPANEHVKDVTLQWIGLPGDCFMRLLKAVTLPLVFVNVSVAVCDMMNVGQASQVGWATVWVYLGTTVLATGFGFFSILAFSPLITVQDEAQPPTPALVSLGCSTDGFLLTEYGDGSLACANASAVVNVTHTFTITDLNGSFQEALNSVPDDISLSDTIYDGIFTKLFTANILRSFVNGNFPAVVVFATAFGITISRVAGTVEHEHFDHVFLVLKELELVFLYLLESIISFTPFAVLSLIVKAFGCEEDSTDTFARAGCLTMATLLAMVLHFLFVHVGIAGLVRHTNPLRYLSCLVPAQTMAFASSSSAATIPMTLKCIRASGIVPSPISYLVVPLGATINMDGSAIYFPCACIWLATINGDELNLASCLLLVIISTLGSVGTAPVPSAALAVILTTYNTVFQKTGTPAGFELLVAVDWLLDRFQTVLNVTGDAVVCSIVAHICPLEMEPCVKEVRASDVGCEVARVEAPLR